MTTGTKAPAVLAGGAVLWTDIDGVLRIALVHRPRYDDWSLPKGKIKPGEHPLIGAVREVWEETGAAATVGRRLTSVEYPSGSSTKRVHYWAMRYRHGEHEPSDEVDEVAWLTPSEALGRLTYGIDRGVLEDFLRLPPAAATIVLMRHAKAGRRSDYRGEDRLRPLDKIGRRQARDSVALLTLFAPEHILSADLVRCEQTVLPLAHALDLTVDSAPEYSDEQFAQDPHRAVTALLGLAEQHRATVVASQGGAIPGMLTAVLPAGRAVSARKGSAWVLTVEAGSVLAADYYSRPYSP